MLERVCTPGIPYAECVGRDLKLDLYLPDLPPDAPPPPVVVYMHGGGWLQGTRSGPSGVAFALELAAEGLAVASIDYRLGPQHPAPAAIEDCKLAVRFIRSRAAEWGVSATRMLAMGNSAGGHLAAMLGLTRPQDGLDGDGLPGHDDSVQGVISLCGIADLERLLDDPRRRDWVGLWVPGDDAHRRRLAVRCSPLTYVGVHAPPFLIVHGRRDGTVPFEQAELMHGALTAAGADTTLSAIDDADHLLGITGPVSVQNRLRDDRRRFMRRLGFLAGEAPRP
jgi:acetyl esterase/lipase